METLSEISVIIPVYNDRESLGVFSRRLAKTLGEITDKFELIFVDDGSTDNSLYVLKELKSQDKRLKIIRFSRNFGMQAALFAGFNYARGRIIVTIDGDLQNAPEDLPLLLHKLYEGNDIVSGWRSLRKDSFLFRRMPSFLFNLILSFLVGRRIHDIGCTFKIFKEAVIRDIIRFGGLLAFTPQLKKYNYAEVKINHYPRLFGESKFGLNSLIRQARIILAHTVKAKFHIVDIARPGYIIDEIYE